MVYNRMYVLSEEEYKRYKAMEASQPDSQPSPKCPEDGREYPNAGMLGHHIKTHVNGFQCNICGKVFKTKRALTAHLKRHPPQVQPSTHSIFDNVSPTASQTTPPKPNKAQTAPPKPKKAHKRRSVLNFSSTQWLTLR